MKNFFIIFSFIFLALGYLQAQDRFTVNATTGCAPFTVQVTTNLTNPEVIAGQFLVNYRFDDDMNYFSTSTHTYDVPGTYVITQLLANAIPREEKVTITVVEAKTPEIEYYICNDRSIHLDVKDNYYESYFINWGDGFTEYYYKTEPAPEHQYANTLPKTLAVVGIIDGSNGKGVGHDANNSCGTYKVDNILPKESLTVPTLSQVNILNQSRIELKYNIVSDLLYRIEMETNNSGDFVDMGIPPASGTFTVNGLDTKNNSYCYRIILIDPCSSMQFPSNIGCSIKNHAVTAENNQNRISWEADDSNLQNLQIFKDNNPIANLNANQSPYLDLDIVCNLENCYKIVATFTNGVSTSEEICATGITQNIPPAIENATLSIFENDIHMEWPEPQAPIKNFIIEKSQDDGSYSQFRTQESNVFLEKEVNISNSYHCYRIFYDDDCGNVAPVSIDVCPILLTIFEGDGPSYELTWTQYTGWKDGVSQYLIEKINAEGNVFETIKINAGTNNYVDYDILENQQVIIYRITAISNSGENWKSFSNIVRVEQQAKVFLPSAFTPNNDFVNDVFIAKGTFIKDFQIKIFNRWGELIFFSADKDVGWNGNVQGKPAKEGGYIYTVQVTDYNDKTISLSGAFMLIRNR
ncbi:MAG: gliding motility-associated C-terminal domain-containing protein [Bacteroidota bacterium]|nr:gliding motility-associated C-terminal domain-containing protein [Bacteroidota bacterium]